MVRRMVLVPSQIARHVSVVQAIDSADLEDQLLRDDELVGEISGRRIVRLRCSDRRLFLEVEGEVCLLLEARPGQMCCTRYDGPIPVSAATPQENIDCAIGEVHLTWTRVETAIACRGKRVQGLFRSRSCTYVYLDGMSPLACTALSRADGKGTVVYWRFTQ